MAENPDLSKENFSSRMLYKTIRSRFPRVNQLSTNMLENWLQSEKAVLLVDIREKDEQSVSSLTNAIQITPADGADHVLSCMEGKEVSKVVAFCSMGYRSCEFIKKLYKALRDENKLEGVHLYNLEGGLFKWANEDKKIVDTLGQSTNFVHPYNAVWGKFLNPEKRKCPEQVAQL